MERKRQIKRIYDGYRYQMYGQYFAMKEMGYTISQLEMRSIVDNRTYEIILPENDAKSYAGFCSVIRAFRNFRMDEFIQTNPEKCRHCIYEPACDRGIGLC